MTATFIDPDTQDTGKVTFEVCTTSNCSSSLGTFDSTSTNLAVNANGSAAVPGGYNLANGTTYYWRAKNVDCSAAGSSFSATQSFIVDTAAPTMSSATVAANGTTVTVTWSENLDQTQAVPGTAFSIAPNGGADIAGTATAVHLSGGEPDAVHALERRPPPRLARLTYTKPGTRPEGPRRRTRHRQRGRHRQRSRTSRSRTTRRTSLRRRRRSSPPPTAALLNTATPTLTATFSDPDTQDTGKVTFEVCSTSNCSSSLGTFDSTSTTLAVGANGSAAVPGGFNLTGGTILLARQERRRLRRRPPSARRSRSSSTPPRRR